MSRKHSIAAVSCFKTMIGVPTLDQLVEAVVFDVPSLVTKTDDTFHGYLSRR